MKAVIELDVPEWQIGQDVSVYFPDTMVKHGKCELLKEQEEQKRKWLRNIADNQLANAPKDRKEFMSLDEHMEYQYQLGVYDGLQMAWDILTEDDNGNLYHLYCEKCGWDWWSAEAFPDKCPNCKSERK